jgi:hypothetical protein
MMRKDRSLALAFMVAAAAAARADENFDLDLIPPASQQEAPPAAQTAPAGTTTGRLYLEETASAFSLRGGLPVRFPGPAPADWEERLFLDAREQWQLVPDLSAIYSGRLNLRAEDRLPIPSHENVRNDFREGYLTWQPVQGTFIDAGRFNEKDGVSAGYNPTDFFKTHAVIEPLSLDPAVLREDRLGTAMLRVGEVAETGSLTAIFAPQFERPSPIFNDQNLPSFDPTFGRTNAHDRLLVKGSANLSPDFAPEFLLYREGAATRGGFNLTEPVGRKIVAYLEWSGGDGQNLAAEALQYGRATGAIAEAAPAAIPVPAQASFRNKATLGASYATESNVTFNFEYHYDGAGFSHQDWRNWFNTGTARANVAGVAGELWYIRDYALDVQEPMGRQSIFARFDWVDAIVPNLEITGFVSMDLYDGSSLAQVSADYYLSNAWTVGAIAAADLGSRRTDFGSLPQAESLILKLARDF